MELKFKTSRIQNLTFILVVKILCINIIHLSYYKFLSVLFVININTLFFSLIYFIYCILTHLTTKLTTINKYLLKNNNH
jgi:hypothetical protein